MLSLYSRRRPASWIECENKSVSPFARAAWSGPRSRKPGSRTTPIARRNSIS